MTEQQIYDLHNEYSLQYTLYNAISTAVENYDGVNGGLRAPELWSDVLVLEQRVATAVRPDRFVAVERTRLTARYRQFHSVWSDGTTHYERARTDDEVERSVTCVLLAFGMRLASYPDSMKNPYEPIMNSIRRIAMTCNDLEMLAAIVNDYYDGEDDEEAMGNYVPEEDVLRPHLKPRLDRKMQLLQDKMKNVTDYFSSSLAFSNVLGEDWSEDAFYGIWSDLLMNEQILHAMAKQTGIKNTLHDDEMKDDDPQCFVKTNKYNLHLVLNLIGVMIDQKVILSSVSHIRQIFFKEQSKDKYLSKKYFIQFGTSDSAFATEEMYQTVLKIIENRKNYMTKNTEQ